MPFTSASRAPRLLSFLFLFSIAFAHAQNYTSVVIFGDSLSDTGNVAHLTQQKYGVRVPGPYANYADGLFTDGNYTVPAARNYFGVWVEQLAALLPAHPATTNSLDGGSNYAYGFATTGSGTAVFSLGTSGDFVNVENVGQQISDYLATRPTITNKTLFILWAGAIDVLDAKSASDVSQAALNQIGNIQRLIDAGATQFIIPNLPALGAVPELNHSPSLAIQATAGSVLYNAILASGIAVLRDFNPGRHLNLVQLDVFSLFNRILASPSRYAFANVTSMSQGDYAVDPDTYLFWDDLHPTTHGHNLLAITADALLAPENCSFSFFGRPIGCDLIQSAGGR